MIYFFKMKRWKSIKDHKYLKYSKYVLGEIFIVIIGILIALSVNNWNNQLQDRKQERNYLIDIKRSLLNDKKTADQCVSWNTKKIAVIDSMMKLITSASSSSDYMDYLVNNSPILGSWRRFYPEHTAFNNLTASDNISIIQNKDLRKLLSEYYNFDWERSSQSITRLNTRNYDRIIMLKLISDSTYHKNFGDIHKTLVNDDIAFQWSKDFENNFQDANFIEFHNDRVAVAAMFIMKPNTIYHSRWINRAAEDIDSMLIMIDKELQIK